MEKFCSNFFYSSPTRTSGEGPRAPPAVLPRDVGNGALGDDAEVLLDGHRQKKIERFLVGDIDRGLQRVKLAALNGIERSVTVAAVADIARMTALASALERVDDVTLAQFRF